jgi:UDP-N-acetylglucosamine 2-epimerase (non-hydrolysing)
MELKILRRSDLLPRIGVVVGTRPGIIKFAPVIKELQRRNADFTLIHTGQHYSPGMDSVFFEDLELPAPHHLNGDVASRRLHGEQTAAMIVGVERAVLRDRPAVVVVGGDANTNLAAALAVRKLASVQLAHMEAGLRSGDWSMPEEHNRIMIDHIAEILFVPTEQSRRNLERDNVQGRIIYTGNTIVDAVHQNRELAARKSRVLDDLQLVPHKFILVTCHREENVDQEAVLRRIVDNLVRFADEHGPLVFPMHPRTRRRLEEFGIAGQLEAAATIRITDPLNYLDMLQLMSNARAILTDSGGIQEEACILKVPCLTIRENTERPETVDAGSNLVVGTDIDVWRRGLAEFEGRNRYDWENPYGDGEAARRIVDELIRVADEIGT